MCHRPLIRSIRFLVILMVALLTLAPMATQAAEPPESQRDADGRGILTPHCRGCIVMVRKRTCEDLRAERRWSSMPCAEARPPSDKSPRSQRPADAPEP